MLPEWRQRGGLIEYFQPSNLELASGWDEISFLPCRTLASFPVTRSLWRHLRYVASPWLKFGCTKASSLLATVSGRSFTCPGVVGMIYDKFFIFYLFTQFTDSVFKTTWQPIFYYPGNVQKLILFAVKYCCKFLQGFLLILLQLTMFQLNWYQSARISRNSNQSGSFSCLHPSLSMEYHPPPRGV